jgi:hypothetical protein
MSGRGPLEVLAPHKDDFPVTVSRIPDGNLRGSVASTPRHDDDIGVFQNNEYWVTNPTFCRSGQSSRAYSALNPSSSASDQARDGQGVAVDDIAAIPSAKSQIGTALNAQLEETRKCRVAGGERLLRGFSRKVAYQSRSQRAPEHKSLSQNVR